MAPVVIAEFTLGIEIEEFMNMFWLEKEWYEQFLIDKLSDLSVSVGEWTDNQKSKTRNIRSFHPSKISFPGLPSHAESLKLQTLEHFPSEKGSKYTVKEINTFRGIPYSDYFSVNTEFSITRASAAPASKENVTPSTAIAIYLDFTFFKSTWLQGTIESNTKAELIGVYELWREFANATLRLALDRKKANALALSSDNLLDLHNEEKLSVSSNSRSRSLDTSQHSVYSDDEMFYDCEEGSADRQTVKARSNRNSIIALSGSSMDGSGSGYYKFSPSNGNLQTSIITPSGSRSTFNVPHTPPELHALYGAHSLSGSSHGYPTAGGAVGGGGDFAEQPTNARDLAVNIVEGLFVLAEFSYWKIYTVYTYDLKELFNVDPASVLTRIRNSFLPGWHAPILLHPDIYGPLLAVFTLPQSLLISMETSRHGCNPTSQLGNAVVVSLFIWLGLSCLYRYAHLYSYFGRTNCGRRLLSLLIAPTIGLNMTGYSFFSWNLALLCSFPLELYGDVLRIPMMLPLVVLGIPSSLALGCMFWEQTPSSNITLQPQSLPTSMQQFATNNSRILQKILWAFPKIIAFVLVTGTHYQFLWYMARVFLPGRKQLCQLSALVQPSQYADILTQKELRKFAIALLLGNKAD